jgi:hypothetical protein
MPISLSSSQPSVGGRRPVFKYGKARENHAPGTWEQPLCTARACDERRLILELQPALYFFDLSGGNGVIADNTSFKIPNLAGPEVQDSIS